MPKVSSINSSSINMGSAEPSLTSLATKVTRVLPVLQVAEEVVKVAEKAGLLPDPDDLKEDDEHDQD